MRKTLAAILFSLSVLTAPALAQEVTEPAPVVTETPAPPVVEVPNSDTYISISTLVFGFVVAILSGGTVGAILVRFGTNRASQDATEKLFKSFPPETQDTIIRLLDTVDELVKFGRVVTDGKPNDPPAISNKTILN